MSLCNLCPGDILLFRDSSSWTDGDELWFLKYWWRADVAELWWRYDTNELMSRNGVVELIFLNSWWWDSVVLGLLNWYWSTGITELLVIILCCQNYVEYLCCWTAIAQLMFLSCCRWGAVSNLTCVIWYFWTDVGELVLLNWWWLSSDSVFCWIYVAYLTAIYKLVLMNWWYLYGAS